MNLFYTTAIQGELAHLPEEEARHCVQVLRHREGDSIYIVDGNGGFYKATIVETGKKSCLAHIEEQQQEYGRRNFRLHLGIAPTKNISRMEWLLEKVTEMGIDAITPLLCEHSERRKLRTGRLNKILLSAMKQSLKAYLPQLNELTSFPAFLRQAEASEKYLAYLGEGVKGSLKDNYRPGNSVCILIGPEGGFSEAEAASARDAGFLAVSLGPGRLRTETAGLVACHTINLLNQ